MVLASTIGRLGLSAFLLLGFGAGTNASAQYVIVPDVVVLCEPTLKPVIADLGALWRRQTGIPVYVFSSPTPLLMEQVGHRARSDLVIGESGEAAMRAFSRKLIKSDPSIGFWRNRLVVAESGKKAASSTSAPVLTPTGLSEAGPIAVVDAAVASAGTESRKALEALGLWEAVQPRITGTANTADASFLLESRKARYAMIYATDVAADRSFSVAATVPDDIYRPAVYWISQTAHALSSEVGRFETFLKQPTAQQRLRSAGLEVLP